MQKWQISADDFQMLRHQVRADQRLLKKGSEILQQGNRPGQLELSPEELIDVARMYEDGSIVTKAAFIATMQCYREKPPTNRFKTPDFFTQ